LVRCKNIKIIILILLTKTFIFSAEPKFKESEKEYIIGKGDILKVIFINPKYNDLLLTVSNDGYIESKLIIRTKVEGLTLLEAKEKILNYLKEKFINPEIQLKIYISRKIEQTKFYNDFKTNLMIAEQYFNDMKYEDTLKALRNTIDLLLERLKILYPDKYGDKVLFLQLANVNFKTEGINPFKTFAITGDVINHTDNSYNWVKVKINFLNQNKKIINMIERYIISDFPIKPMERKKFELKGALNVEAEDIEYSIVSFNLYKEETISKTK